MRLFEKAFFYPNSRDYRNAPDVKVSSYQDVWIQSNKSILHGWYVTQRERRSTGTVLHFHGNAANITNHWPLVCWAIEKGLDVLTFDYRGFGKSSGSPSFEGVLYDCSTMLQFVCHDDMIRNRSLLIFGQSIGGFFALAAMQNFMPTSLCGIILDSTFGSIYDLAVDKCEAILPFGAEMAISSLMGRNIPEISLDKFVAPKLIIHSFLDPVVPFSHGNNLHERLPQPKKLIPTSANGHIEFFANKNTKQWQVFEVWLSSLSLMS